MSTVRFAGLPLVQSSGRKYVDDEGFVVREGKGFVCGDHPEKGFSLTREQCDANIGRPAPNDFEHLPTVVTHDNEGRRREGNHLGDTTIVRREGDDVIVRTRVPQWLDRIVGETALKVSTTWNQARELVGTALCLNPHIPDAAVFTAFAADPSFSDFAASNPEAAGIVNAALKAPNPANPMNPQEIKDAAWTTFSADPKNAGVTRESFEAAFATPAPQTGGVTDPTIRAELDRLNERDAQREAEFNARTDQMDAERFFLEFRSSGQVAPKDEADALADFAMARFYDRGKLATFTANADGSAEKALRDRYGKKAKQFTLGPSPLDGSLPVNFTADEAALKANPFYVAPKEGN